MNWYRPNEQARHDVFLGMRAELVSGEELSCLSTFTDVLEVLETENFLPMKAHLFLKLLDSHIGRTRPPQALEDAFRRFLQLQAPDGFIYFLNWEEYEQIRDILEYRLYEGGFTPKKEESSLDEKMKQEMEYISSRGTEKKTATRRAQEILDKQVPEWVKEGIAPEEIERRANQFLLRAKRLIQEDQKDF